MPQSSCCPGQINARTKKNIVLTVFSLLIVLDVIGFLDSVASFTSCLIYGVNEFTTEIDEAPVDLTKSKLNETTIHLEKTASVGETQLELIQHVTLFLGELFCFLVLFLCNTLGISGVRNTVPYLLVPWLGVYMVGILSCYIASSIFLLSQFYEDSLTVGPLVPAVTGLVFHVYWCVVNSIFNDIRTELRIR